MAISIAVNVTNSPNWMAPTPMEALLEVIDPGALS
jgi:hypothetical protein